MICKPCMTAVTDFIADSCADHQEKPVDRADDPDLAEKMKAEAEGIFLWAFEGLQRLVANNLSLRRVSVSGKTGSGQA